MSDCLRVRWTIVPRDCPRPVLACPTCGGDRPYHPSGKLRLNANGKRLDVWLIYKCDECDRTWNRPLLDVEAMKVVHPGLVCEAGVAKHQP